VVDFTQFGALLLVAAAEAIGQSWRFAVVRIVSSDVAAMAAFVRLHTPSAVHRASVTARPLLGAPTRENTAIDSPDWCRIDVKNNNANAYYLTE